MTHVHMILNNLNNLGAIFRNPTILLTIALLTSDLDSLEEPQSPVDGLFSGVSISGMASLSVDKKSIVLFFFAVQETSINSSLKPYRIEPGTVFLFPMNFSGISFLLTRSVPVDTKPLSKSSRANGMLVKNLSNTILRNVLKYGSHSCRTTRLA